LGDAFRTGADADLHAGRIQCVVQGAPALGCRLLRAHLLPKGDNQRLRDRGELVGLERYDPAVVCIQLLRQDVMTVGGSLRRTF
jgi:hypothetical protein